MPALKKEKRRGKAVEKKGDGGEWGGAPTAAAEKTDRTLCAESKGEEEAFGGRPKDFCEDRATQKGPRRQIVKKRGRAEAGNRSSPWWKRQAGGRAGRMQTPLLQGFKGQQKGFQMNAYGEMREKALATQATATEKETKRGGGPS